MMQNHGGGYQFRICPAGSKLDEECFQKTPLEFAGEPLLRYNNGSEYQMKGTFVSNGTSPAGSTWQMNPIPRIDFDSHSSGQPKDFKGCNHQTGMACRQFEPPCPEGNWQGQPWHANHFVKNGSWAAAVTSVDVCGDCSGDLTSAAIVDKVKIPNLPAGDYVVGFRWDW